MNADLINALFELGGALAILLSLRRLVRDKRLAGYDPLTLAFFTAWGFWNLHFYGPATGNWLSWRAGIAVVAVNCAYLVAMAWYSRHPGGKRIEWISAALEQIRYERELWRRMPVVKRARLREIHRTREMLS